MKFRHRHLGPCIVAAALLLGTELRAEETEVIATLRGHGQEASQRFSLNPGLTIFTLQSYEDGLFSVALLDEMGEHVERLALDIGVFEGSRAVQILTAGTFILDIEADGQWVITVTSPRAEVVGSARSFSGHGQRATEFFTLPEGLHIFRLTHNGKGVFAPQILDLNGSQVERLALEIGTFDGSKAVKIPYTGAFLMQIDADGDWSVVIE